MPSPVSNYNALFQQAGAAQGIDPRLLGAIATVESGGNPSAVSPAGAQGLVQLMPQTAKALGVNPLIPAQAIKGEAMLLKQNMDRYHNTEQAVAAYFGGTNQANWGPETRQYVQKVAKAYQDMAPPAQTAPVPAPASDGPITLDMLMKSAQPPAPGAQAAAPAQSAPAPSDGPITLEMLQKSAAVPPDPAAPSLGQKVWAGAEEGLHAVTDLPAEAVARGVGAAAHALGIAPNWHPGQTTAANDQAANAAYQNKMAQYPSAQVANVAAQIVGGTAELAAGGGVLGAGAKAAGAAIGGDVGAAINAVGKFVGGDAGAYTGAGVKGFGAKLASKAAQGAVQGAGFNALTGRDPTAGAVYGAFANPALGAIGAAAGGAINKLAGIAKSADTQAAMQYWNALINDGVKPDDAAALVGVHGNLPVNAGGANVRALAEKVANKPGAGSEILNQALEGQVTAAHSDIANAITHALGSNGDVHDLAARIIADRSAAAAPKFTAAFNYTPDETQTATIQNLINQPRGRAAVQTALTNLRDQAEASGQAFDPAKLGIAIGDDGHVTLQPNAPTMPFLHSVKEGLDDNIEKLRDPTTGRLPNTKEPINLDNIRANLRNTLTAASPDYADALNSWSGPSKVLDAMAVGRKALAKDSEVTAARVQAMDPTEKAGFQAGFARALMDKLNGTPEDLNAARKMLRTPMIRNRVAAAFDDPKAYQDFENLIEAKAAQAAQRNEVLKGSQTARRLAAQGHNWSGTAAEVAGHALAGNPVGAAAAIGRGVIGHAAAQGTPDLDTAIANLLVNPDSAYVQKALQSARPGAVNRLLAPAKQATGNALSLYAAPALLTPRGS